MTDSYKRRAIYRVSARNLEPLVVHAGEGYFIGLRFKFGWRLDGEFAESAEIAPYLKTIRRVEETALTLPDAIEAREILRSEDVTTGRPVSFDRPIADGGRGWYFTDTNEASQAIQPVAIVNQPLFDYLKTLNETFDQTANEHD